MLTEKPLGPTVVSDPGPLEVQLVTEVPVKTSAMATSRTRNQYKQRQRPPCTSEQYRPGLLGRCP